VPSRAVATAVLALMALGVVIASAAGAYATFDFWESGALLGSLSLAAAASAGAIYAASRRVLPALMVALVVAAGHFVLLLAITLSRWEG
jgi:hypothetical protein